MRWSDGCGFSAPPPAVTAPRPEPRPFFPLGRPEPRRHHRAGLSASLRSRSSSIRNAVFFVVSSATGTFSNHERPLGSMQQCSIPCAVCSLQFSSVFSWNSLFSSSGGKTSAIFKTEDIAVIVRSFVPRTVGLFRWLRFPPASVRGLLPSSSNLKTLRNSPRLAENGPVKL